MTPAAIDSTRWRTLKESVAMMGPFGTLEFKLRWRLGQERIPARVRNVRQPVLVRRGTTDYMVLSQIFHQRELDFDLPFVPRIIVDGGANVGYASIYYATRFPAATIVAVEPDAANCSAFEANLRPYENVSLLCGALWHEDQPLTITNPNDPSWGLKVGAADEASPLRVPAFTIPGLLQRIGADRIDLLKLDIEGAEQQLFENGAASWIDAVRAMVIEIHSAEARRAVDEAVASRGFTRAQRGERVFLLREDN